MSFRLKMSHTIERWYRTILDARIHLLRMAVPALRSLEWNDEPKKSNRTKTKLRNPGNSTDIVDERGYIDGGSAAKPTSLNRPLSTFECLRSVKRMD
ncbi:hypothetical protein EV421DRAFT_1845592 [Armillaria borealis]|uniref:Uncharacterized protein n=1 Tax=Armillaria borealis TaxID=47425 RepID=A0AA39J206_9AGAR|nr:hypothetical protein EV421DRAFT_1845592 [Armillaria borealis]